MCPKITTTPNLRATHIANDTAICHYAKGATKHKPNLNTMKKQQEKQLNLWLKTHNVNPKTPKFKWVFDGTGCITKVCPGDEGGKYYIQIKPFPVTHNLGAGAGNTVTIEF